MATIAAGLGGKQSASYYPTLRTSLPELSTYRTVVLMVIDGLGYEMLQTHLPRGYLARHVLTAIDSVFPSTTATAITTFLTGQAPQQHALTGWHVYDSELAEVTAVLPFRPRQPGSKLTRHLSRGLYDQIAFADRLPGRISQVTPGWISASRFNTAYCGKARCYGYSSLSNFLPLLVDVVKSTSDDSNSAPHYVYAYYPELDRQAHQFGCNSSEVQRELLRLDQQIAAISKQLQGLHTLLLITADHGFVDTSKDHRIELEQHPLLAATLALPLCGESRAAYCYVQPSRRADFEDYVGNELSRKMTMIRADELINQGHFGYGPPHVRLRERVGDYALIMSDNYVLKDWLPGEERYVHIGVHGGTSSAERKVPLIGLSP